MQCKYCGKECKNVILHEIRCKNNPNKLPPVSQLRKVTSNQYIKAKELGLPKPQLTQEAKEKCARYSRGCKFESYWGYLGFRLIIRMNLFGLVAERMYAPDF